MSWCLQQHGRIKMQRGTLFVTTGWICSATKKQKLRSLSSALGCGKSGWLFERSCRHFCQRGGLGAWFNGFTASKSSIRGYSILSMCRFLKHLLSNLCSNPLHFECAAALPRCLHTEHISSLGCTLCQYMQRGWWWNMNDKWREAVFT